jgi:co-chaperonin GroES (HSP10)
LSAVEGGVLSGFVLSVSGIAELEKRIGRSLPPELWTRHLTGHRILVVPEPVSERTRGLLYKPRSAIEREQLEMGAGWVVAVGPLVGQEGAPHPVGVLCSHPTSLLGRHVLFRQYSGVNLKTSQEDTEFGGPYALIVLTDRDVLSVSSAEDENTIRNDP